MDTPNESAASVVVTPVPATSSRLMWLGWIITALGPIVALVPELATDPLVIAWLDEVMSPRARKGVGLVVMIIGYVIQKLRKSTVAPITGTPAAANAQQLISPSQSAPARTKEDS